MNNTEKEWALEIAEKIISKMEWVFEENKSKVPYSTDENGRYDDWSDRIGWWTNGFWGGIGWQLYNATQNELFADVARDTEDKMDEVLMTSAWMDHDSGFRWLPTSYANYKLTGDKKSYNRLILAADNMCGRFNPVGNYIKAWNPDESGNRAGIAIIDCMMNLPLLYWAYNATGDPKYLHVATLHAQTAMKYFIREDGSSCHIVEFDPMDGHFIDSIGGQGYGHGSSWTRGQTWAIYGFALSYMHTGDERYLETSKKVADYFISSIPDSYLIPVDFRQPSEPAWEDSTAAAIAACGLLELEKFCEGETKEKYHAAAIRLLQTLTEKRCDFTHDKDNIVEKCTAAYHDAKHEFAIIYGDYYYIEAIWKLTGKELFIWGK